MRFATATQLGAPENVAELLAPQGSLFDRRAA
jgi:hypothetical protein